MVCVLFRLSFLSKQLLKTIFQLMKEIDSLAHKELSFLVVHPLHVHDADSPLSRGEGLPHQHLCGRRLGHMEVFQDHERHCILTPALQCASNLITGKWKDEEEGSCDITVKNGLLLLLSTAKCQF